eukprot:365396-Chlamydomonas_euryale.AAC.8
MFCKYHRQLPLPQSLPEPDALERSESGLSKPRALPGRCLSINSWHCCLQEQSSSFSDRSQTAWVQQGGLWETGVSRIGAQLSMPTCAGSPAWAGGRMTPCTQQLRCVQRGGLPQLMHLLNAASLTCRHVARRRRGEHMARMPDGSVVERLLFAEDWVEWLAGQTPCGGMGL